jgi:glyoxalase family protein
MEQVNGNHHLTMSVGPAQEDYDFHTRTLDMRSIKKTVLFDGQAPIYHLNYGNADGTASSVLTTFPFRQAGVMGRRGTNQVKVINLAVPKDSLASGGPPGRSRHRGRALVAARHGAAELRPPSGIPYALVEVEGDTRAGHTGGGVGADAAIHGSYGVTVSIHMADEMTEFLELGMQGRRIASEGASELWQLGDGPGNVVELVEEPDMPHGTWRFGEGTVHHVAFDAGSLDNQMELKLFIEGLGYTDVSDVKDRQYFNSCYVRTPGGPLFELAVSKPESWAIDEAPTGSGRSSCCRPGSRTAAPSSWGAWRPSTRPGPEARRWPTRPSRPR